MAEHTTGSRHSPRVTSDLKREIARELGLFEEIEDRGWPAMASRQCGRVGGRIGGRLVREMIRYAERELARGRRF